MRFEPTRIPEVLLVKPEVRGDERGYFLESWHADKFRTGHIDVRFVQDNQSRSAQWVLRGLHYQIRQPQGKLVRVARGAAFDVAVDLRKSSPTFGQWVGAELSDENHHMLWIPHGFAHGCLALTPILDLIYKCTDFYAREHERALRWDDPQLAIDWPLPRGVEPILSQRDRMAVRLSDAECFV